MSFCLPACHQIRALFLDLGQTLEKNGGKHLVGATFSAADLAFASLSALILCPEGYGADLSVLEKMLNPSMLAELRATPAGKHAQEMFRLYREPAGREAVPKI